MLEANPRQPEEVFPAYEVDVGSEVLERPARNSIGGCPFLDEGQERPECFCGERLMLFFQLDLPLDLGPLGGDHRLLFHCRTHNETAIPDTSENGRIVPEYWDAPYVGEDRPFWRVLLQGREAKPWANPEPYQTVFPEVARAAAEATAAMLKPARA